MAQKARIGLVLTFQEQEARKGELIDITRNNPSRPWITQVPKKFQIEREANKYKDEATGVPGDVSMGQYISYKYGNDFDVDFISPTEITAKRLKANDINFLITYDLLEAFHTDKKRGPHALERFTRLSDILRKADNVYPNFEFQEFVYSKLLYYSHFQQVGLPILPTITISKEQWNAQVAQMGSIKLVAEEVLKEIKRKGLKEFLIKPVYGQEAKGCMSFETDDMDMGEFAEYMRKMCAKYPGLVIQKFVDGFGQRKCPEVRFFFVGGKYQYAVVAVCAVMGAKTVKGDESDARPVGRTGGWISLPAKVNLRKMKNIARKAIENMPHINLKRGQRSVSLPSLMIRVDMGCIRDGVFKPWINEVEFVPSLYLEDHNWPIDAHMGDQMVNITKQYLNISDGRRKRGAPVPAVRRLLKQPAGKFLKGHKLKMEKIAKALAVPFSAKGRPDMAKGKRIHALCRGASRHVLKRTKSSTGNRGD